MAAYGVIGGFIGGAIALAITPWLRKRVLEKEVKKEEAKNGTKKSKKGKNNQGGVSYRPWGTALFLFLCAIGDVAFGFWFLWLTIFGDLGFNLLYSGILVFIILFGVIFGCWTGSFLCAKITISRERLVIEHASKMPIKDRHIHFYQLGRYHLDVRWEEIRELRADINWMKIILRNDECYTFPIGWCKEKARAAIARHKPIKPWE